MYRLNLSLVLLLFIPNIVFAFNWLQNSEQQAATAFEQKKYSEAAELFTDSYRRGVALYREGQFAEAAAAFASVDRPEVKMSALYNLGNAYFQQKEYEKAIQTYEQVLAEQPDHQDARYNLALAQQQIQPPESQPEQAPNQETKDSQSKQDKNAQQEQNGESQQNQDAQSDSSNPSQAQPDKNTPAPQPDESNESKPPETTQQTSPQNSEVPQTQSKQSAHQQNLEKQPSPQEGAQSQTEQQKPENEKPTDQTESTTTLAGEDQASKDALAQDKEGGQVTSKRFLDESDMEADAFLNQIAENPQQLLRNQFYLDAQQAKIEQPDKPW